MGVILPQEPANRGGGEARYQVASPVLKAHNRRVIFGLFDSPWHLLGLAGWCFLMGWGFRIGLLRMALSLGALGLLTGLAWLFKDARTPALVYGPLAFVGVICVISVGIFGRGLEQRLGYGSTAVRVNHAGGLLLGLLIGGVVWLFVL